MTCFRCYHNMLRDCKGNKVLDISISDQQLKEMMRYIHDGVIQKLDVARKMADINKEFSAGLYIYAIEEFGKILVLRNSELIDGRYKVNYRHKFTVHLEKFNIAADYLRTHDHGKCLALNNDGGFDVQGYSSEGYSTQLSAASSESRLSIFYSDFDKEGNIEEIPEVDLDSLQNAINELEIATNELC